MVAEAYGEGEPRYRMLEPVRQYGRERLEEGGEAEVTRERHAGYYLALVEEAAPKFRGVDQQVWVERLERERGNLRAALGWALEQEEAEPSLRLSGALGRFWNLCGYLGEGRRWLEAALAKRGGPGPARAKALTPTGWIAWSQGDYELSLVLYEECLRLSREIGDGGRASRPRYTLWGGRRCSGTSQSKPRC